jgi:CRISPR/Cas system CSM-associated protein Csm3 (group 7 of RAMP superfamily)
MSWKRWIHEVRYAIRLVSPLHIGAERDELLLNENGRAVIPGSSLAGAWRAFVETQYPDKTVRLFGRRKEEETGMSDLFVHDLVSERVAAFEERPAVRIDGAFGTADDKGKFDRYYVAADERFNGKVVWTADDEERDDHRELMIRVFSAWHHGFIRLGQHKSTGAGRVEITAIRHRVYDCWDPNQYFEFLLDRESGEQPPETWGEDASEWLSASSAPTICQFRLSAELDSALLIRGNSVSKSGEPDAVHIRNVSGRYIIPGSSWKGVLRHHVEKIARYYGVPEMVERIFGHAARKQSEGQAGVVITSDALIENAKEADYTGIRIDRLTGGVMSAMLKKERTVRGSVELELDLRLDRLSDDQIPMAKGLLLLAFRDLAEQGLTLGSGYASGRGRIRGMHLTVQDGSDRIVIHYEKEQAENLETANGWISALARRRTG